MSNGTIGAICGAETGTAELAYGKAVKALAMQKHVILIQFLKGKKNEDAETLLKRLEPELKLFRFEKKEKCCHELTEGEKEESRLSVINGLNFAKKVMATGECELLVLEGLLDLLKHQIITAHEFKQVLSSQCDVEIILTGEELPEEMQDCVHFVEHIERLKLTTGDNNDNININQKN